VKFVLKVLVIFLFATVVSAEEWDLRQIANSSNTYTSLVKRDKTTYATLTVSDARLVKDIVDKYSLLSGVYPKLWLKDSQEINAAAGYLEGAPHLFINKGMFDLMVQDQDMAAALIGHEMSHLYFRHGETKRDIQAAGQLISLIAGTVLEVAAQKRGVANVGVNVGSAIGTAFVTSYSRDHEREADRQGIEWAIRSGYDPEGSTRLFYLLQRTAGNNPFPFFQTHPNPSERIENSKAIIASYANTQATRQIVAVVPDELSKLNLLIDEERERYIPRSVEAKSGIESFKEQNYADAKENFEKCSLAGESICVNNLGVIYLNGLGVPIDRAKAAIYFKSASENGLALAKANYASAIGQGGEGTIDTEKIIGLLLDASLSGSANAMGSVAYLEQYRSVAKLNLNHPSKEMLVNYAKAASMRGVREGSLALGSYYKNGFGVSKNFEMAERYLSHAYANGEKRADAELLMLYLDEVKDTSKAETIRTRIISTKSLGAASLLTEHYCGTNFFNRNTKECIEWMRFGAVNGLPSSQRAYGWYMYLGIGLDKNKIEGIAWLEMAKKRGDKAAIGLYEKAKSDFTAQEIERISIRANELMGSLQ